MVVSMRRHRFAFMLDLITQVAVNGAVIVAVIAVGAALLAAFFAGDGRPPPAGFEP